MRALAKAAVNLLSSFQKGTEPRGVDLRVAQLDCDDARSLFAVLRGRQAGGQQTELRQLHVITGLQQSQALRAVKTLEGAGLVAIDENVQDAFASTVAVIER